MPIVNNNYTAPTWVNGQSPSINASELQAMSNTIAQNQTNVASLLPLLSSSAKIESGSYTGTGTSGSENPNSLTFSIAPAILFIITANNVNTPYQCFFINPCVSAWTLISSSGSYNRLRVTWNNNIVTWYTNVTSSPANVQLNTSGTTYYYIAIGV